MKKLIKLTEYDLNILIKRIINEDKKNGKRKRNKVEEYISHYFNDDMSIIFDRIGMDMPIELEGDEYEKIMDIAWKEAKKYYTKHPEEMTDKFGRPFNFNR